MKLRVLVVVVCCSIFSFVGCKKCEECYFIEEVNTSKVETHIGEFCGDEIEEQENKVFVVVSGSAHIECR